MIRQHNDITLHEGVRVELIQHMGNDAGVVHAARVSTGEVVDATQFGEGESAGLINYLMSERHGTPFEHNSITFRVTAPIMVFREWHRHRVQSYNEQSGRYTQFTPNFYIPEANRPLINIGTSARPVMGPADIILHTQFVEDLIWGYEQSWALYQKALNMGIANEMARLHLPVAINSTMYATANLRAWLHFLGLRTAEENATNKGRPQYEIVLAAKKVEEILTQLFPISLTKFNEHGRIAP